DGAKGLFAGAGGSLTTMFSGLFGGASPDLTGGAMYEDASQWSFPGVPDVVGDLFRAKGGPVESGQPYVVGERGPEWFVPSSSGTIIPNGGVASSVKMDVHIHEAAGTKATVQQSTGPGGIPRLDVIITAVENMLGRNISMGNGLACVMENRYGLNPAMGLS
ncbi:MAG: hypothetical protein HQL94_08190, partial [Magnetococcales bacterium]|nr:hypothetical protein [Magnetococcales bacterium]